jgi:hypothetical protein
MGVSQVMGRAGQPHTQRTSTTTGLPPRLQGFGRLKQVSFGHNLKRCWLQHDLCRIESWKTCFNECTRGLGRGSWPSCIFYSCPGALSEAKSRVRSGQTRTERRKVRNEVRKMWLVQHLGGWCGLPWMLWSPASPHSVDEWTEQHEALLACQEQWSISSQGGCGTSFPDSS